MDPNKLQAYLQATLIGRLILEESVFPYLEAFSENALYCRRGMPTMNKYKTVKEVCDLTGLSRKHLYYFHHEKVVQAVAYANYSVEGNDGYKLYDDDAVEKLQQIALYYQLGLKRNEIRDLMRDRNYDSNQTVSDLLSREREKKLHIERNIAALEYLLQTGTKNGLSGVFHGWSLDELGRILLAVKNLEMQDQRNECLTEKQLDAFMEAVSALVSELDQTDVGTDLTEKILVLSRKHLGANGYPFVLGLLVSILGKGTVARDIGAGLSSTHATAILRHLINHPELYFNGAQESVTSV